MIGDMTFDALNSPPLIAVVNNNLYLLEPYSNELRVYDINKNVWEKLGIVPVRAISVGGWGVAFKSLGDRLLLIGAMSSHSRNVTVYTCRPSTKVEELIWERSNDSYSDDGIHFSRFIHNCCVMFV
ncbi:unnamed protein product [Arabis nemorensis]|uniref:F-box associated domain-containing protein n=1 Tax=Arabis nemorensis TaxID=586526 RepID=A0A565C776_9BRAS|nr:unnamed protein product [Arabis nemorensis]